jgi:hypothetical protein
MYRALLVARNKFIENRERRLMRVNVSRGLNQPKTGQKQAKIDGLCLLIG